MSTLWPSVLTLSRCLPPLLVVVHVDFFIDTAMAELESSLRERCTRLNMQATLGAVPGCVGHLGSILLTVSKARNTLVGQRRESDRLETSESVLLSAPDLNNGI